MLHEFALLCFVILLSIRFKPLSDCDLHVNMHVQSYQPAFSFFFSAFFHSKFSLAHCDISLCAGKSEIKVVFSFDELNPKTATRVIKIKPS